ncbi:Flp pilus assembly protein CpaB [Pseudodesulfovibrio sp. zrk46]|uniref:Flp pilus assembly protein CpaB n=1 Tax=Pseudodesulfovibrio sp. zrk46 TaxID=2725288 RepID=UPI0014492ED4|nr:Flp pilus assembly protein CpaB [Pseudodesulfovibrio sp. zrk46]QJB55235.1 Flp pilus assembly protein CpaB [Pseudodesulfovibrio sp. zrk46]
MSKSTRALIQIALALMLAMAAGVLIFMWTSKVTKQPTQIAAKVETVNVVVAKVVLRRGVKLTPEMLDIKGFTPDSRPGGAFGSVEEVVGRVLNMDVGINDAVTASKLADPSVMGGGVSALIEPGKRAMSVKGNEVMGLAGFVRPGDRVDVIVSMTMGQYDNPVTKLVLERVKVLATGTELSPPDAEGKTASVDVYTLELTPKESERLALAATHGTLNFALRNEQDDAKVLTTGATKKKTIAALRPKAKPRPKQLKRNIVKVEVITGGDSKTLKF